MSKTGYHSLRVFALLITIAACSIGVFAQNNATIKGTITDDQKKPLPYTSIVLLRASDSTDIQFTLSENDGGFVFKNVPAGNYVIQSLYSGYQIQNTAVNVRSGEEKTLFPIQLIPSTETLKEALVVAKKIPMVFKGDTIVYNPNAFKTNTSATVEDLLKKLPGVQVSSDGTVTAQGEQVVKVLVNGKEFFGNDPTKATKNINADAIEKVEVLDKKSDESQFTGSDDGTREKVINLVLKEDANKGYFGKIEAGAGTDETYRVKGSLNHFKDDNQVTVIANTNNLNQNGFDWQEYYNMLNGNGGVTFGNSTYWTSENDWMGRSQQGRQQNTVLGTNANLKIGKKGNLNASYFLMDRGSKLNSSSSSQNFLPQQTILSQNLLNSNSGNGQHRAIGSYVFKPDTLNFLTLSGEANLTFGDGSSYSTQKNETDAGSLLNNSLSQTFGYQQNLNVKSSLRYFRKFKNSKHYVSFQTGFENNNGRDTAKWVNDVAYSEVNYTETLPYVNMDYKKGKGQVYFNSASGALNFKKDYYLRLTIEDKYTIDNYTQVRSYLQSDSIYGNQSPDIEIRNNASSAELNLSKNMQNPKDGGWFVSAGLQAKNVAMDRTLSFPYLDKAEHYNQNKLFVLPRGWISYRKPKVWRLGVWLNSDVNLPTLGQLNSVQDVSNPVRISGGNFQLDPTVTYSLGSHFNKRNSKNNTFWYGYASVGMTPNSIISYDTRDSNNFSVSTYGNHGTTSYSNGNIYYRFPIPKLKLQFGFGADYSLYNFYNVLNEVEYLNNRKSFGVSTNLQFQVQNFEIEFNYNPDYSYQNSALLTNSVAYWKHNFNSEMHWNITKAVALSWDCSMFYYNSQQVGQKQLVPILNSTIDWKLDSLNKWTISVNAYDMMNRAKSINRNFFGNTYTETRQNTLTRYLMFNVIYAIKKGKKKEEEGRHWMD
ncbi:MAG: outer membrane beta-barrel protein [Bacteroidetes bacterium]|nr:outer membrane beta-barrel protein [Bacteroidota bacterium]